MTKPGRVTSNQPSELDWSATHRFYSVHSAENLFICLSYWSSIKAKSDYNMGFQGALFYVWLRTEVRLFRHKACRRLIMSFLDITFQATDINMDSSLTVEITASSWMSIFLGHPGERWRSLLSPVLLKVSLCNFEGGFTHQFHFGPGCYKVASRQFLHFVFNTQITIICTYLYTV